MSALRTAARAGFALVLAAGTAQAQVTPGSLKVTGIVPPTAGIVNTPQFNTTAVNIPGLFNVPSYNVAASSPSPYVASFTGGTVPSSLQVFCVDMLNNVSFSNTTTYGVNATNLGLASSLSATRFVDPNALTRYRKASYLASLWSPSFAQNQRDDLQLAIWSVMYDFSPYGLPNLVPANVRDGSNANRTLVDDYILQANAKASANFAGLSFANAYVITQNNVDDVAATSLARYRGTGIQEFVTAASVVPEPSTYVLMGTGLLAIAGVARRRRQAPAAQG